MKRIKSLFQVFFGWLFEPAPDLDLEQFERIERKTIYIKEPL